MRSLFYIVKYYNANQIIKRFNRLVKINAIKRCVKGCIKWSIELTLLFNAYLYWVLLTQHNNVLTKRRVF